jgi:CubicO group peptidase (beta-lactamase class C family)
MGTRSFSEPGLGRLRHALAEKVGPDTVPGLVWGASRGSDVLVEAVGFPDRAGGEVMRPDAPFRITSMTRPVTAVAALLLVQDGRVALDGPIGELLPELAHSRVLRRLDGPLDDTVPADRPISVRDLLTFRAGFGTIMADPREYPILMAEAELQLCSVGPPIPVARFGPAEWMRRMGSLPRMEQPGA